MASLMEVLIQTLDEENQEYEKVLETSKRKTGIIVKGDLEALHKIMAEEQVHVDKIVNLERRREESVQDIATVLSKDADTLTVRNIIELLEGQEEIQKQLIEVHDKLKTTLGQMVAVNDLNKSLLQESLEMVEFDINLMNSLTQAPEINNYTRGAYNVNTYVEPPKFDAKN